MGWISAPGSGLIPTVWPLRVWMRRANDLTRPSELDLVVLDIPVSVTTALRSSQVLAKAMLLSSSPTVLTPCSAIASISICILSMAFRQSSVKGRSVMAWMYLRCAITYSRCAAVQSSSLIQ